MSGLEGKLTQIAPYLVAQDHIKRRWFFRLSKAQGYLSAVTGAIAGGSTVQATVTGLTEKSGLLAAFGIVGWAVIQHFLQSGEFRRKSALAGAYIDAVDRFGQGLHEALNQADERQQIDDVNKIFSQHVRPALTACHIADAFLKRGAMESQEYLKECDEKVRHIVRSFKITVVSEERPDAA